MEKEIDLYQYIRVLHRRWKLIIAVAMIAAMVAAAINFVTWVPVYTTYALVGVNIAERNANISFDRRFSLNESEDQGKSPYIEFSRRPELTLRVLEILAPSLTPEQADPEVLQEMVQFRTEKGSDLIIVTAQAETPRKTADVANTWAEQFVQFINEEYEVPWRQQTFLEEQLKVAAENLGTADEALVAFQKADGIGLNILNRDADDAQSVLDGGDILTFGPLDAELGSKIRSLAYFKGLQDRIELVLQEAKALKGEGRSISAVPFLGLLLEFWGTGVGASQIDLSVTPDLTFSEDDLDALISALEQREESLANTITQISEDILPLQDEIARNKLEWERLERVRNIAADTYVTLAHKVEEAQIIPFQRAHLILRAMEPLEPKTPFLSHIGYKVALAAVLGLLVGMVGVYALEYFQKGPSVSQDEGL